MGPTLRKQRGAAGHQREDACHPHRLACGGAWQVQVEDAWSGGPQS